MRAGRAARRDRAQRRRARRRSSTCSPARSPPTEGRSSSRDGDITHVARHAARALGHRQSVSNRQRLSRRNRPAELPSRRARARAGRSSRRSSCAVRAHLPTVDEIAAAALEQLDLAGRRRTYAPAIFRTATRSGSTSRSRSRPSRRSCCSTNRSPACRSTKSARPKPRSASSRSSMTVLIIEHDMDLIMGISDSITVLHQGRVLAQRNAGRDPRQPTRAGSLSRRTQRKRRSTGDRGDRRRPCSRVEGINTLLRRQPHPASDVSLHVGAGETVALLGRNGVGKTTTLKIDRRLGAAAHRQRQASTATNSPASDMMTIARARRLARARRAPHLHQLDRRRKPPARAGHRAQRPGWSLEQVYEQVPAPARAPLAQGRRDLRRREADARDRPRARPRHELLLLDEPTEGLAPLIVREVEAIDPRDQSRRHDDPARRAEPLLRALRRRPLLHHRSGADRFEGTPDDIRTITTCWRATCTSECA